jgi:hypothetical protein
VNKSIYLLKEQVLSNKKGLALLFFVDQESANSDKIKFNLG